MRTVPLALACLLCCAAFFVLQGCEASRPQKTYSQGGKAYGVTKGTFRGRWWNYYERGLSFADGGFWKEAEGDLRKALGSRDQDKRRAKTYGMHFIDYFPHRELGIALFHQGRYEEAVRELEASLRYEKSAKAEFYLDSSRKEIVGSQDASPPQILLQSPAEGDVTNQLSCEVVGLVRDDTLVKRVTVDGKPVRMDVAVPEVPFQTTVPLKAGENTVRIEAGDLTGKAAVAERRLWVDVQGPMIAVDAPERITPGRPSRLTGYIHDDSGVEEVKINGLAMTFPQSREVQVNYPLSTASASGMVTVEARDTAGNRTRAELSLARGGGLPAQGVRLASLEPLSLALFETLGPSRDTSGPGVELKHWTEEQTVFFDQVYLEGTVRDSGKIASLSINGRPVLKKPANTIGFARLVPLQEGDNTILIEAEDESGNREKKQIIFHRKLPKIKEIGSRLRLVLMPLERKGDARLESEPVEENLLAGLMERRRFDLVERQRLEDILRELKLSRSELADPEVGIRAGKIASAHGVLMGSVVGKGESLEIYLRLVDTESSAIITAVDVYREDADSLSLRELCRGLVLKLCDELPLVEGLVVQVNGSRVITDLGVQSRIKKGMRLIIFEKGAPVYHPVTGTALGTNDEKVGHALVQNVYEHLSDAEAVEKEAASRIQKEQGVITQ